MKNFIIGMYGKFDENKYQRDFREGFWGIEGFMLSDKGEALKLADRAKKDRVSFGVHFPLIKRDGKTRDPLFISLDGSERREALLDFEEEVRFVSEIGAKYILTHFPKPFIMDPGLNWNFWRFADERERILESECSFETVKERSFGVFEKLSELSKKNGIKIILENDLLNKYFYEKELLYELFNTYPQLGLCLDFGRLHLQEKIDPDFHAVALISEMVQFVDLIHLWNARVDTKMSGGHYPVLPELSAQEGWGDIGLYLKTLTERKKDLKVQFEHRSDLISEADLDRCYSWVDSFFK